MTKLRFEEIACFSSLLKLEKQAIKLVQAGLPKRPHLNLIT
ncbi:MAG: hypothetical protein ACJAWV_000558 [Flammeovirgaceae bacterium]